MEKECSARNGCSRLWGEPEVTTLYCKVVNSGLFLGERGSHSSHSAPSLLKALRVHGKGTGFANQPQHVPHIQGEPKSHVTASRGHDVIAPGTGAVCYNTG